MSAERVTIRSYRRIFRVERRLYKVDRWVLPVPGGVPLRGLAYFVAALAIVVALGRLPVVGALLGLLSPPLRYVILPLAAAVLGTHIAPDGRSPHRFAWSWLAHRLTARRRSAGRPVTREGERSGGGAQLHLRADATTAELRRARVRGPGRVEFSAPVALSGGRRGRYSVRSPGHRGRTGATVIDALELHAGERLEVQSR